MSHLVLVHTIVGKPEELEFDNEREFSACLICGQVYQHPHNRLPLDSVTPTQLAEATKLREEWKIAHARSHPERVHEQWRRSGRFCTPEAAHRLVPLGIAPVSDMVFSAEHADAAYEAPRLATNDVEGPIREYIGIPDNHVLRSL